MNLALFKLENCHPGNGGIWPPEEAIESELEKLDGC